MKKRLTPIVAPIVAWWQKNPANEASQMRMAFTLVELLVVIAIIGILVGLLLPAVQAAREASRRISSQNNLKQLAIACHLFHDSRNHFPAAANYPSGRPLDTYSSWIVPLLPFIEQGNVHQAFFGAPSGIAQAHGPNSPAATVIPTLLAPSDALGSTAYEAFAPGVNSNFPLGRYLGLTSYGCNGGTAAPLAYLDDGIFHYDSRVRLGDVSDGSSNTLLLGERYGFDPMWGKLTGRASNDMRPYSAWSGGPFFSWRSSMVSIGFRLPLTIETHPPASGSAEYFDLYYKRLFAYGSSSSSGASLALCDGSVRFMSSSTNLIVLRTLATRANGEMVPEE